MHSLNTNSFYGLLMNVYAAAVKIRDKPPDQLLSPESANISLRSAVDNQHMLHYIRDKTAVPYFSNLVWFIGSHVIELDKCVQTDEE